MLSDNKVGILPLREKIQLYYQLDLPLFLWRIISRIGSDMVPVQFTILVLHVVTNICVNLFFWWIMTLVSIGAVGVLL